MRGNYKKWHRRWEVKKWVERWEISREILFKAVVS